MIARLFTAVLAVPVYLRMRRFVREYEAPLGFSLPMARAIVVLGGRPERGLDAAVMASRSDRYVLIASGTSDALKAYLPADAIHEDASGDTPENARNSARILRDFPDWPVVLVTDIGQLYRARMLFRFEGIEPILWGVEGGDISIWQEAQKYVRNWFSVRWIA